MRMQGFTRDYRGIEVITLYKGIQRFTGDYKGLRGFSN